MEIAYTEHAKQRMLQRKISRKMVEETLANPTAIVAGKENRKIALKEYDSGVVEIVFTEENSAIVVISVRWG